MKTLVAVFVYNEGEKLTATLGRFPTERDYDVVVMDDGSTDGAGDVVKNFPFAYLRHEQNRGAGAAIRTVIEFANQNAYDILVLIAGNGKMNPSDIAPLVQPVRDGVCDLTQGSRYMPGGKSENLPLFRRIAIPLFTLIVRVIAGYKTSDVTCGFRALRLDIVRRPEVDLSQTWLDRYEMEYYIVYKAVKLGYRTMDVPVAMTYPPEKKNYSKIPAITGWWSMIRPWIYLSLGIRK